MVCAAVSMQLVAVGSRTRCVCCMASLGLCCVGPAAQVAMQLRTCGRAVGGFHTVVSALSVLVVVCLCMWRHKHGDFDRMGHTALLPVP